MSDAGPRRVTPDEQFAEVTRGTWIYPKAAVCAGESLVQVGTLRAATVTLD